VATATSSQAPVKQRVEPVSPPVPLDFVFCEDNGGLSRWLLRSADAATPDRSRGFASRGGSR
jgi:hypothetical protein